MRRCLRAFSVYVFVVCLTMITLIQNGRLNYLQIETVSHYLPGGTEGNHEKPVRVADDRMNLEVRISRPQVWRLLLHRSFLLTSNVPYF